MLDADAAGASCAAVRGLFWPLSCRHFGEVYWERRYHLTRASPASALLGAAEGAERVLASSDLPRLAELWQFRVRADHAQAVVLRPGSFSHDADGWPPGSLLGAASMRKAHAANRTVVLHNVELYHRPIGRLTLALSSHFGVYAQANVYWSPPAVSLAVHAHQDAQSVFILQCEGRKVWTLLSPPDRWRLRHNQRGKAGDVAPESELGEPTGSYELAPGDVLFIPRGVYHHTSTASSVRALAPLTRHP